MNWNKYQSKVALKTQNPFPSRSEFSSLKMMIEKHTLIFFPKAEIKDYNVMINGKIFFDEPVKND